MKASQKNRYGGKVGYTKKPEKKPEAESIYDCFLQIYQKKYRKAECYRVRN